MMDAPFPDAMLGSIKQFLDEVGPALLPGKDLYPEVFHSDLFYPLQRMREVEKMVKLVRSRRPPKVFLEVGADKGGGVYHWLKCFPEIRYVIANEIRGLPYAELFEAAFPDVEFLWLPGSSRDHANLAMARRWLKIHKTEIDVLFIDGDKTAMDADFRAYLPLLSHDFIALLHDVQDREPKQALESIASFGYATETILDTSEALEALEREARGEPVTTPYEGWLRYWKGRSCGVGVVTQKGQS